jgi:hypothetical protein
MEIWDVHRLLWSGTVFVTQLAFGQVTRQLHV